MLGPRAGESAGCGLLIPACRENDVLLSVDVAMSVAAFANDIWLDVDSAIYLSNNSEHESLCRFPDGIFRDFE